MASIAIAAFSAACVATDPVAEPTDTDAEQRKVKSDIVLVDLAGNEFTAAAGTLTWTDSRATWRTRVGKTDYVVTGEIASLDPIAGTLLSLTGDLAGANVRLQQAGVTIERRQRLVSADERSVTTVHVFTGEANRLEAEAVIDCGPRLPNNELARAIDRDVTTVGDAVAARTVGDAIREGRASALALGRAARTEAVVP